MQIRPRSCCRLVHSRQIRVFRSHILRLGELLAISWTGSGGIEATAFSCWSVSIWLKEVSAGGCSPWAARGRWRLQKNAHLRLRAGLSGGQVDASCFRDRQRRSVKMLSRRRPQPAIRCPQAIASNRREGDPGADPFLLVGAGKGRELRTLTLHGRSNQWLASMRLAPLPDHGRMNAAVRGEF